MSRRTHLHSPDVPDVEYGEIMDRYYDEAPTRAELDDDPTWPTPKVVRADTPLLAALQAGAERGQG